MEPKYNRYEKSRALFERAARVIPSGIYGHQGPAEGCFIPVDAFPFYSERAKGSYFWDVDGNRFIDYMCAYGPNILGYGDEEVDEAAKKQLEKENCVTAPSLVMVDFAELLTETVASADWSFFRQKRKRRDFACSHDRARLYAAQKIVFFKGYYHGVSPWTQKIDYSGVLEEEVCNNLYVPWNDFAALEQVFAENPGQIAAVISQPYMHGNFADNELPADGFWQKVRQKCTAEEPC